MASIKKYVFKRVKVYPDGDGSAHCCDHRDKEIKVFLAWHRFYMVNFERGLHAAGLDESIGIPYWEWTDGSDKESLRLPSLATEEQHWLGGIIKGFNAQTFRYFIIV